MTYTIDLIRDDTTTPIEATPEQTVLEAAEDAAESLPFGCRTGACGTCTGRLVAGHIDHRRPPRALKEAHLEKGYALLCIAEPRSDCRIAVGKDVVAELVENPWK